MASSPPEIVKEALAQRVAQTLADPSLTPAAVLLTLYSKDGEYCILLNKRTDRVEHHKGEISFPGGKVDEDDKSALHAALRETHEEMGIRPEDVRVLGAVDDVPTNSYFLINTFVGTIPYPYEFKPSAAEVAEVLEVPVSTLLSESSARDEVRIVDGKLSYSPVYAYREHLIFGATARILEQFLGLLDNAPLKEALWKPSQPQR